MRPATDEQIDRVARMITDLLGEQVADWKAAADDETARGDRLEVELERERSRCEALAATEVRLEAELEAAKRRWSLDEARIAGMLTQLARLSTEIRRALDELGVPDETYPAPVAEAVRILREALG